MFHFLFVVLRHVVVDRHLIELKSHCLCEIYMSRAFYLFFYKGSLFLFLHHHVLNMLIWCRLIVIFELEVDREMHVAGIEEFYFYPTSFVAFL